MNPNNAVRILVKTTLLAFAGVCGIDLGAARRPGVRHDAADNTTPRPLAGLASDEMMFFQDGLARFGATEVVSGASASALRTGNGLGPRFNSDSCQSCHMQPNVGGSSPARNPLISVATTDGAANSIPWFIAPAGPVREARFVQSNGVKDGGVHDMFVVTGRSDAGGCALAQPAFTPAGDPTTGQGGKRNMVFRIPTPLFGAGLIEVIPDSAILDNAAADVAGKISQACRVIRTRFQAAT